MLFRRNSCVIKSIKSIKSMGFVGPALQVKATAGSTKLGGDEFDNRLIYFFAESFEAQQQPLRRCESTHLGLHLWLRTL